jgi:hypothetical protein
MTYYPLVATRGQDFAITPGSIQPCKVWWTDESGQRLPVFAGLPFLSWWGNYGIHGPIDNFRAENGGNLRRGYVSHGCVRMEGADVLEVYARIRGVARVPVHVQREPERVSSGDRVDVVSRWIGSECTSDQQCNFDGGVCHQNAIGGRGFCTRACSRTCPDRAGAPATFCVANPAQPSAGMCVPRETAQNRGCRDQDHFVARSVARFNPASVRATACVPGSRGWVGDRCAASSDCQTGNQCVTSNGVGICTQRCQRFCPDQTGTPWTVCVNEAALGGSTCLRQCTPASNASECPADHACVERRRADGTASKNVCLPN